WHFDEGSGSIIYDSSGYGNSQYSWSGNPQWVDGQHGDALEFDGNDDIIYIDDPGTSPLDVEDEVSIEAWIYDKGGGSTSIDAYGLEGNVGWDTLEDTITIKKATVDNGSGYMCYWNVTWDENVNTGYTWFYPGKIKIDTKPAVNSEVIRTEIWDTTTNTQVDQSIYWSNYWQDTEVGIWVRGYQVEDDGNCEAFFQEGHDYSCRIYYYGKVNVSIDYLNFDRYHQKVIQKGADWRIYSYGGSSGQMVINWLVWHPSAEGGGYTSKSVSIGTGQYRKWHYIVCTYKKNDRIKIYVDGVEKLNQSAPDKSIKTDDSDLYLGWHNQITIDELRIWRRALTKEEIQSRAKYGLYRASASNGIYTPVDGAYDTFNRATIGSNWTETSNANIIWNITNNHLRCTAVGDAGYAYIRYNQLDVTGKDILIEYDVYFNDSARWGGIWYRGIYCDVNPTRRGWRDDSQNFYTGDPDIEQNKWYHIKMYINISSSGYPKSTLYINDIQAFKDEPIEKTSWGNNNVGFVSNYYDSYVDYDNFTVTLLLSDNTYTDTGAQDVSTPNQASSLSSTDHPLNTWSNDSTVTVTWTDATDNGDDYYYYMKAFDDDGNINNLIENGVFEDPYYNGIAHGWSAYHTDPVRSSTTDAYSGEKAQSIIGGTTIGGGNYGGIVQLGIADKLENGKKYIFTIHYKSINATGNFADVSLQNGSGDEILHIDLNAAQTGVWYKEEAVFTANPPKNNLYIWSTGPQNHFYIDEITLYPIESVTVTTGLAGYAVIWTHGPQDITFETINVSAGVETVTSPSLSSANDWYFNIRSCDNAGNWAPSTETVHYGPFWIDVDKPSSSVDAITPYLQTSSPITITATASDALSGIKNVTLYYYNSSDNTTWFGPWSFGTDTNGSDGWSWSFTFPKGEGYYRFYSIAIDNASNQEDPPAVNDTECQYSTVVNKVPAINSYDLRNSTGSKLNDATGLLDVNREYYFIINVTDGNGWSDIQYINITAWYDNGTDPGEYNQTGNLGGNLNMFIQYENTTGTANFTMIWPKNEAELVLANCSETIVNSTT
ncbi:MAG: hypothetical protein DRJ99_03565, partial [Thermoplasmata archaeon]